MESSASSVQLTILGTLLHVDFVCTLLVPMSDYPIGGYILRRGAESPGEYRKCYLAVAFRKDLVLISFDC